MQPLVTLDCRWGGLVEPDYFATVQLLDRQGRVWAYDYVTTRVFKVVEPPAIGHQACSNRRECPLRAYITNQGR
jgi:hypothetical protein